MKPSIGRFVRVVLMNARQEIIVRPAIITSVSAPNTGADQINASVFMEADDMMAPVMFVSSLIYDESGAHPGGWHWPPRES
jgi:hypothetical protein